MMVFVLMASVRTIQGELGAASISSFSLRCTIRWVGVVNEFSQY